MDRDLVAKMLRDVKRGALPIEQAIERLATFDTIDLGFAKLDRQRQLRRGVPEVVYGAGKSESQVCKIVAALVQQRATVLVTRIESVVGEKLARTYENGEHDPIARTFLWLDRARSKRPDQRGLLILSAGSSDAPVAAEAAVTARAFGLTADRIDDVGVAGLHRLLDQLPRLRAADCLIVVAGMEGALPSVVTGLVDKPVIGVPTSVGYGAASGGFTPLLAMLTSCAGGLTVVNIDNGFGAACAAFSILSLRKRKAKAARRNG